MTGLPHIGRWDGRPFAPCRGRSGVIRTAGRPATTVRAAGTDCGSQNATRGQDGLFMVKGNFEQLWLTIWFLIFHVVLLVS
jgi:hypothetical protein